MKKLPVVLLTVLMIFMSVSVITSAGTNELPSDFVKDGEFTVISFHSMLDFVDNKKDLLAVEDMAYWVADVQKSLNVQFVSFNGTITGPSMYTYGNTMSLTEQERIAKVETDTTWLSEYEAFADNIAPIRSEKIPFGVAVSPLEYYAGGFHRKTTVPTYFPLEKTMSSDINYSYYDDQNFCIEIENDGVPYLIFQLELWPQTPVLDWFNTTMKNSGDKRAIVYTVSYVDNNGAMYTMWDWNKTSIPISKESNGGLGGLNMAMANKPRDGEGIWNYAFSQWDNIYAVISSNKITKKEIVTSIQTNERGYQNIAIGANPEDNYNDEYGVPTALITKFSNDGEITVCYHVQGKGYIEESLKTVKLEKLGELDKPDITKTLPKIEPQYNGANKSYILGYEGNLFKPNNNMTRAEACTIFARLILGTNDIPTTYTTRFTDVKKSDWFYGAVAFLDESGFFYHDNKTTYKPNEPITRAEFVDLAYSASTLAKSAKEIEFGDVPENHVYYKSIIAAAASGLVNGYEDYTFRPDNTITRAEVVTVVNRLLNLDVSDKTVDASRLSNTFNDTKGHWAINNILMASNSDVHGAYYYKASLDGVEETDDTYIFANKHFSITVGKKGGKVEKFVNLYTGEDINNNSTNPQFIYLLSTTGSKIIPTTLETDGNRIKVTFRNDAVAYLIVDIEENYMSFEIDSEVPSGLGTGIVFANIITNYASSNNPKSYTEYRLGRFPMTYYTHTDSRPVSSSAVVQATAYNTYDPGVMGAKVAVLFTKNDEYIDCLKDPTDAVDRSVGLASDKAGAYARENEDNFKDYVIVSTTEPVALGKIIDEAVRYEVGQIDIHQGGSTFVQGDFTFPHTKNGTAKEFYEDIGKKATDAGVQLGLHTYAFFIARDSVEILSNPKWQKQLMYAEGEYTLRKDVTATRGTIPTEEDVSKFPVSTSFLSVGMNYIIIDEEIIRVTGTSQSGFAKVDRGQCGTKAVAHAEGAKIRHLTGKFNMFLPELGSELFWEIADRTAKAYNDGGFSMIYMDAIDGLGSFTSTQVEHNYWFNAYVHRILSQCHDDPVVEFSTYPIQDWNVRGRMGATDTPHRAIKAFIRWHADSNIIEGRNNWTTTLGWFHFYTDMNPAGELYNTISKTLFHDDMDLLGTYAILYGMSMVYNSFDPVSIQANPTWSRNIDYYNKFYNTLRKSNYFTEDTIERVKEKFEAGSEFRVVEKAPGEYAFLEMYYAKNNVGNLVGKELSFKDTNPYGEQTPFIRIESRYSTEFEDETVIIPMDETKTLANQKMNFTGLSVYMAGKLAMKVNVKGTGRDGDALLIAITGGLTGGESGGLSYHFIDLNYEGWQEHILLDADNNEYDTEKYTFSGVDIAGNPYKEARISPSYTNVEKIEIKTCKRGYEAIMDDIVIYSHTEAPIKNPSVTVGSSTMTFHTEMKGGEYLEYDPLTSKTYLYHTDQTIEEVTSVEGKLTVPSGNFKGTFSAEAQTSAPIRAKVVLGFSGEEFAN